MVSRRARLKGNWEVLSQSKKKQGQGGTSRSASSRVERACADIRARSLSHPQLSLSMARRSLHLLGIRDGGAGPRLVHHGRDRVGAAAHRAGLAELWRDVDRAHV